jgi:O-acetyl-ADP-ribose deacetylase (regulator of RNase III)
LLEECRRLDGCATGQAKITAGYRLPARHVIHTVGPVWRNGDHHEADLLASCYRNAMALAESHGLTSLAFPAISTGVYGYPPAAAARIAVHTVRAHPAERITLVRFVCFDGPSLDRYRQLLDA